MQSAVIVEPGRIEIRDVPLPQPGPLEVRVRLEGCGVCASNLELWTGQPWFEYPLVPGAPGHEGWGRVDAVGSQVKMVDVGERVAMLSGRAYAEYDTAPVEAVLPLPDALDARPLPLEPLGCAINIFRRSGIEPGQTVAIIGIGFLGAILTRLASGSGARVIAISRRPYALEIAREFGAPEAILMDDHRKIIDQVMSMTEGRGCERVIEAVGRQWPLDLATELSMERGRLIIAGYHQDGPRQVNMQLWNWRGLDVINAHERDPKVYVEGMRLALAAIVNGELDPSPLYTHSYPLKDISDAFDVMQSRPDGFLKALVTL
jgi:threonine dehydrogenase-like Zn-dependent dehydrogenase